MESIRPETYQAILGTLYQLIVTSSPNAAQVAVTAKPIAVGNKLSLENKYKLLTPRPIKSILPTMSTVLEWVV